MEGKMIVGGKYELAELVAENEESRTFAAREIASGRPVLAHQILAPPPASSRPSLKELARLCVPGRGGVIDTYITESGDYVVTEVREGSGGAREWLEGAAIVPPPASRDSGEDRFTRVGAWRVPSSFSTPPPPPPEIAIQPTEPVLALPPTPQEPGEFTGMFRAPAAAPSPPPPPQQASSEPGDFTRMFQASSPSAKPSAPPPASRPGEFTGYFQSRLGSKPFEEPGTPAPAPVVPPAPAARPPGEYTRLFQMPAAPSKPVVPGSGATHVFVTPSAPLPQSQAPMAEGPSDFTRIIRSSSPPAPEPRPAEPAAEPPARRPAIPAGLVIALASLAVLAIGMVLYFALRR